MLGLVAGTAVMGKVTEELGDSLTGFVADLTPKQIDDFFNAANPHTVAHALLRDATTRIVYDIDRFALSAPLIPETRRYGSPPIWRAGTRNPRGRSAPPGDSRFRSVLVTRTASAVRSRKKCKTNRGRSNDGGPIVAPRWTGSGWTIFNNKGLARSPVRAVLHRDHAFEFDWWCRRQPGPVLRSGRTRRRHPAPKPQLGEGGVRSVGDRKTGMSMTRCCSIPGRDGEVQVSALPARRGLSANLGRTGPQGGALGPDEQQAAAKTARHADTPSVAHFDALGRALLPSPTTARTRNTKKRETCSTSEGNAVRRD